MRYNKVIAFIFLASTFKVAFCVFPVTDYTLNLTEQMHLQQAYMQTAKMIAEVANSAQTVTNTLNTVVMAKRNLEKFTDWQNLSGFASIANKIQQAGDVGSSLGYATGGIAKGLTAMTGDKYSSMSGLQDTLTSVGRTLDTQSNYMSRQNAAYDKISNGLSSDSIDGVVSVMQGNANLLNAVAQQNQDISNKIGSLNKIQLAKAQNEINDKNIENTQNIKYQVASLSGLLDYHDDSKFDFTAAPKYTY